MPKALYVLYYTDLAGAENYTRTILSYFKTNNLIEADLFLVYPKDARKNLPKILDPLQLNKVQVHQLAVDSISPIKPVNKLLQLIDNYGYDIIVSNLIYSDVWCAIAKLRKGKSIKVIAVRHGYKEEEQIRYQYTKKANKWNIFYWVNRWCATKFDGNICVSAWVQKFYVTHNIITATNSKIIYLGLPISTSNLPPINTIETNPPYILFIGRLKKIKGIDLLFEALKIVLNSHPSIQLKLAGSGIEELKLKAKAKELSIESNVEFLGFQNDPYPILSKALFVVIPSLTETFGLVLLESFINYKPVIGFDVPAINELIVPGKNGLLVPPYDIPKLADAIIQLIEDKELRKQMSEAAHSIAKEKFSMQAMAAETIEYISSL